MSGFGNNLNELRRRIQKAREDLAQIGSPEQPLPEVIETTNLLRANEYLTKTGEKKAELLSAYEEYAKQLEQIVASLLSIQADLKAVRTQASVITTKRKKPRKKQRVKKHKKTRKKQRTKKRKKTKRRKVKKRKK